MRKPGAILLFSLLMISCLAIVPTHSLAQNYKWTFMVYVGADSSLEGFGIDDFIEMATVGSTSNVSVVVQFDRRLGGSSAYGDWTTTKRFLVEKDMTPDPANAISDIGEVNMGDPQVLVEFVDWSMTYYPADRYFLVLWGHGLGWQGVVQDTTPSSDYLEPDELDWAFSSIMANNSGKKIDLVGADACRMTTEMTYELKDYVRFFVGSQKDEPEPGWPYDTILSDLTGDPGMGPAELGRIVADRYVESYIDQTGLAVALSVVDASRLEILGEEVQRFVEQARSTLPMFVDEFKNSRLNTENYEGNAVYDLYDTFDKLRAEFTAFPLLLRLDRTLHSSKQAVLSAVIYERNWDNPVASVRTTHAHGMSIWYPLTITNLTYHELDFSKTTGWNLFLEDFRAVVNGEVADPEVVLEIGVLLLEDADDNGLIDTIHLALPESPQNATLEIDVYDPLQSQAIDTFVVHLPENTPRSTNITLPEDTFLDLDFYLLNESGILMNNSLFRNILVKGYTISGLVHDKDGEPIIGASVTIENVVSGQSVQVQTNSSGYSGVILPFDLKANTTDTIMVTAEYSDWTSSSTFLMFYPPEEKEVNFVLGPEGQNLGDSIWLWLLVALVIIETFVVIMFALMLRGRGGRPEEKTGEELLRELKLE